jgi:carboxymethylenebutenolidase
LYARRDIVKTLAGLPLAALLGGPQPARAAGFGLHEYTINTPGGRRVSGALAMPLGVPAPTVLLIHEWWGLNDRIRALTAEFGRLGYLTLAVDLMAGRTAETPEEGRALAQAVDPAAARDTLAGWIEWLRVHDACNRRIGAVGWGFGGAWALDASIASPVEATVVYYGGVDRKAEELARLRGPVLGHFATRDPSIDRPMVSAWEKEMDRAGKAYATHWYEAGHGFANPASASYDEPNARLARERTLAFLDETL